MNAPVLPLSIDFQGDASLGAVLDALAAHAGRRLVLRYAGKTIQPGYHVTEVKAGSFVTLDCGGNPDAWQETILQVEDLPASAETTDHMTVATFIGIIEKVGRRVALSPDARLTFEVGPPDQPMQILDVAALSVEVDRVFLQLQGRAAICKPRHRVQQASAASSCCETGSRCC